MRLLNSYLMENLDEIFRLEIKTDPEAVRKQAKIKSQVHSIYSVETTMKMEVEGCLSGSIVMFT